MSNNKFLVIRCAVVGLVAAIGLLSSAAVTARAAAAPASSTPTSAIPPVGKLFYKATQYGCTGTVLNTPKHNIVLTAKHCTTWPLKLGLSHFIPGYDQNARNPEPYGRWQIKGAYDGPGDLEVLVMEKNHGKNIQDVVGGQDYQIGAPIRGRVSIIGYPNAGHGRPYDCEADATVHAWHGHPDEWQTDCGKNFGTGVSGSAYMLNYDRGSHRGTVVAALGGDHEGSAGPGGELSLGDPLTSHFKSFLDDVLEHHA